MNIVQRFRVVTIRTIKQTITKCHRLFYGVDGGTTLEPSDDSVSLDNNCISDDCIVYDYNHFISLLKCSTIEYYNMRMSLGLECA